MTTTYQFNLDLLAANKQSKNTDPEAQETEEQTLENQRFAVLERSVYVNGVKTIRRQERLAFALTLAASAVFLTLLYVVTQFV
jgi:hypothetical protein